MKKWKPLSIFRQKQTTRLLSLQYAARMKRSETDGSKNLLNVSKLQKAAKTKSAAKHVMFSFSKSQRKTVTMKLSLRLRKTAILMRATQKNLWRML